MLTFYLGGITASALILITGLMYRPNWLGLLGCVIVIPIWPLTPLTVLLYWLTRKRPEKNIVNAFKEYKDIRDQEEIDDFIEELKVRGWIR